MAMEEGRGRGFPFGDDYPDSRAAEAREREREDVGRQTAELGSPRRDDGFRRLLLDLMQERRLRHPDETVEQFDVIRHGDGLQTLVASGELLIERQQGELARATLERAGFQERRLDCPELVDRLVRYVQPGIAPERLLDFSRMLRGDGLDASLNHIGPLAGVVKGRAGPEPSEGARVFASTGAPEGDQVRVAVIDTGIAAEQRSDGWLDHGTVPRHSGGGVGDNIDELDRFPAGGDGYLDFATGHGTFTTGVIQQVFPDADIRVYRAVDSDGVGSEVRIGCAMIRAVKEGAQILNLSLGAQTIDDMPPLALQAALDVIADIERDSGREVLVVAAAGNYGDTRPCWPAAFRRVVSVGALRANLTPAIDWSSRGAWVDCSTIGEGVVSTYLEGEESADIDRNPDRFGPNAWAVWSGTSFAAPQIVGALARLSRDGGRSPREALRDLLGQGIPLPEFGQGLRILPGT
jgi:Subtilase family